VVGGRIWDLGNSGLSKVVLKEWCCKGPERNSTAVPGGEQSLEFKPWEVSLGL
jgi:hypothetical protein